MKNSTTLSLLAGTLIALGTVVGSIACKSVQAQDVPPLRIAVIDMSAAISGCKIFEQLSNRAKMNLESDWDATLNDLREKLTKAQALYKERDATQTATARDLEVLHDDVEVLKARIKVANEARDASAEAMMFENTLKTIAAANIAIRKVAGNRKYDLVFKYVNFKEAKDNGPGADSAQKAQRAFRQTAQENVILYFAAANGRIEDISKYVKDELVSWDYEDYKSSIRAEMGLDGIEAPDSDKVDPNKPADPNKPTESEKVDPDKPKDGPTNGPSGK